MLLDMGFCTHTHAHFHPHVPQVDALLRQLQAKDAEVKKFKNACIQLHREKV